MKDLVSFGYVGNCEPDGQGGFHGKLLGISEPTPTYRGADLEATEDAYKRAIGDYLAACNAAGRKPATPPEPFWQAVGRDVLYESDVRRDPTVRVLGYYSLSEIFLRARDHNGTARTMAAWCFFTPQHSARQAVYEIGLKVAASLDRYGWHPCPSWAQDGE